jgi:hypothetical protein
MATGTVLDSARKPTVTAVEYELCTPPHRHTRARSFFDLDVRGRRWRSQPDYSSSPTLVVL